MRVLLGGGGTTELGDLFGAPERRPDPPREGVVAALLHAVRDDVDVVDAVAWKRIRKVKAGGHRQKETRNVLGLALMAAERKCDAVAFVRDSDGDARRVDEIEKGIAEAIEDHPSLRVVGGAAVQTIEAWLLAIVGDANPERHAKPERILAEKGVETVEAKVRVVRDCPDLARAAGVSPSLATWLSRARP